MIQDFEEEGQWCNEKLAISTASITAKDVRALTSLQQKHKALEDEMTRRHSRFVSGPADAYLFFSDCNETNSGINEP